MLELVQAGGWLMLPIILSSIIAAGIVVERLWFLQRDRVIPPTLVAQVRQRMAAGQLDSAFLLGHQAIVEAFGGEVVRATRLMHGKTSVVKHDGRTLFAGLPQPAEVGRYHSLIADAGSVPAELEVTASTPEGEIMGVRHRKYTIEGVQFHPESVLTPEGPALMGNFLKLTAPMRGD